MSEPNPYESPQEPKNLTRTQFTKRSLAVAVLILATPPAMIIATACCCAIGSRGGTPMHFGVLVLGPFVALIALMATGAVLDQYDARSRSEDGPRTRLFLITPWIVAGAAVLGLALAALVVSVIANARGGLNGTSMVLGVLVFFSAPSAALLTMLWLAWRAGGHSVPTVNTKTATKDRGFDD